MCTGNQSLMSVTRTSGERPNAILPGDEKGNAVIRSGLVGAECSCTGTGLLDAQPDGAERGRSAEPMDGFRVDWLLALAKQ